MRVKITKVDIWDDDVTVGKDYEVISEDWTGVTFIDDINDVNYISTGEYEIVGGK